MHKDNVKFPNFSKKDANFPNSMGPCPIPKKECESPVKLMGKKIFTMLHSFFYLNLHCQSRVNYLPRLLLLKSMYVKSRRLMKS